MAGARRRRLGVDQRHSVTKALHDRSREATWAAPGQKVDVHRASERPTRPWPLGPATNCDLLPSQVVAM